MTPVLVISLLAGAADPQPEPPLVLVLPVLGVAPREMSLPLAEEIAEALLLQIPEGGVRVAAERPTSRLIPEEAERVFEARGREVNARAVVWGELLMPADCTAVRRIKLRILDVGTGLVLERVLCPAGAGAADLAGAMAGAVAASFRSGLIAGLVLPEKEKKPSGGGLEKMARSARRRCPPPIPCPPCPPSEPPQCPRCTPCPEPGRGRLRLATGFAATSHPRLRNPSLGIVLGGGWKIHRRLELGLEVQAVFPTNSIAATEVRALYHEWPLALWGRLLFGGNRFEGIVDLSLVLSWSRLDSLLERFASSVSIDRFDPALRLRGGVRWWLSRDLALELLAGGCYWLRIQSYNYLYLGIPIEVLRLERWSAEGTLSLVVAFGG